MVTSPPASSHPVHDLVGGDSHITQFKGIGMFCNCFGSCCIDPTTNNCICDGCDCRNTPEYIPAEEVVEVEVPVAAKPDHACVDCGVEVFRNGTRGRYPSRCPACKEKM